MYDVSSVVNAWSFASRSYFTRDGAICPGRVGDNGQVHATVRRLGALTVM